MTHIFNYIDTHPYVCYIVLFAAAGLLLYILKLTDTELNEPHRNDSNRHYSRKP